ncbi:4-carboxymuconolactone decarboxylase [Nocardioides kribbensis]|uniref:bifunctional 3-oxoadipate enol-lactonase/4-carboxymuconolactone decarboxylase PcaDC n=1 Tax=Nocardioides kribbensis TaxID=305517 RepID=UPI0032DA03AD
MTPDPTPAPTPAPTPDPRPAPAAAGVSPGDPPVVPAVTGVRLSGAAHRADLPLLVLGPSLGTSAATLWTRCAAAGLTEVFDVLAWDLPGHGHNTAVPARAFDLAGLAAGVLVLVDEVMTQRGDPPGSSFAYAGDSVGGAVGLQLLLDAPDRVDAAVLLCTGARIGTAASWTERMATVTDSGTPALVSGSAQRWFGPGFLDREPEAGSALLHALSAARDEGYVAVCGALAAFDVRDRLGEITAPVLAVAGSHDVATPPESLRAIADGVVHGSYVELPDVAHLAPAEAPEVVARLVRAHLLGGSLDEALAGPGAVGGAGGGAGGAAPAAYDGDDPRVAAGLVTRREVLGDAHVDRARAATTDFTRDFQDFITAYAWDGVWNRPGLDRRSRSLVTLTALVARGHHEELAMHVRAARTNGVTVEEIREVLLQTAIYCGVPDANAAFRVAQQVLADLGEA